MQNVDFETDFYIKHKNIVLPNLNYTFEKAFNAGYLGEDITDTMCGQLYIDFVNLKKHKQKHLNNILNRKTLNDTLIYDINNIKLSRYLAKIGYDASQKKRVDVHLSGIYKNTLYCDTFKLKYLGEDIYNTLECKDYHKYIFKNYSLSEIKNAVDTLGKTIQSDGKYSGKTFRQIALDKQYISWLNENQNRNKKYKKLLCYCYFKYLKT